MNLEQLVALENKEMFKGKRAEYQRDTRANQKQFPMTKAGTN